MKKNIRTLGKKETYKYLRILEADTINKWIWKKRLKKSISGYIDTMIRRLHKKEERKANYSDQKQHKQHKNQQNNEN